MADRVVIYCTLELAKQILAFNPRLKVMPESRSVENVHVLLEQLHPKVLAYSAGDWTPEIIAAAKEAHVQIYVDRMGKTDGPEGWQSAIDAGADGIQTDRPGPLVDYLRAKGYRRD